MEFNHLSFYVDAVAPWLDWFVNAWGGSCAGARPPSDETERALIYLGQVPLLLEATPPVTQAYRRQHPPGIGDLALRVADLDTTLDRVIAAGGNVVQPIQTDPWG
ncbi:hypothetical protein IQ254_19675, partial [Nodosilinea sp. LEGE 07088]|uniref:VOC family protein n=1 Tax=Nodosilinea sp. LEGE 07088 TaxID=2777968 RepID=UPI0019FC920C